MAEARRPTLPQPPTAPRTWKGVSPDRSEAVRELLVRVGGVADAHVTGPYERWRVRLGRAVFTAYSTGTIYCAGGDEPELPFLYGRVQALARPSEGAPS